MASRSPKHHGVRLPVANGRQPQKFGHGTTSFLWRRSATLLCREPGESSLAAARLANDPDQPAVLRSVASDGSHFEKG